MADDPPLLDPAAYHCQQASDKLLRALLAAAGPIPKSHDLQRLAALTTPLYPALSAAIVAVSDFSPWGTATRYPDLETDLGITAEDIRDALGALDRSHTAIMAQSSP